MATNDVFSFSKYMPLYCFDKYIEMTADVEKNPTVYVLKQSSIM